MATKRKSNKLLIGLGVIVLILLIVVVVGKKQGWIGKKKETEVELAKAQKVTIVEKVSASGMVQPEIEIKISPDVSGEIIELTINEGDSVMQGDLIVKIRPDNYQSVLARTEAILNQQRANQAEAQARLARAEAQFTQAELAFERNKKLFEEKVISDSEFEQAQATYNVAKQDLESAKQSVVAAKYQVQSALATVREANENLSLTTVRAPATGIVSKLDVEKGERVVGTSQMAGTEMLRIADMRQMEVRVNVNENDIIRVKLGDTANIDVDSYNHLDKQFKGVVTAIANTANTKASPDAVTEFEVRIRILNESYQDLLEGKNIVSPFRPGMTASVDIITTKANDVLAVPLAAVTTRDETAKDSEKNLNATNTSNQPNNEANKKKQEVVFVNENGIAKVRNVKTGVSDYDNIQILDGLKENDEVISGPYLAVSKNLKDGDPIKSQNEKKEDKKSSL